MRIWIGPLISNFGNPKNLRRDLMQPGNLFFTRTRRKEAMFVNSDFTDLLNLFNTNQVKYLIIGGYAVVQYAEPRFTKDLDLWISADAANAQSVYQALKEFGAPLSGLTERDFAEEGYFYQMGIPPMRVDILMGIPGIEFDGAWRHRVEVDFDGLVVSFISKQDLIKAKKASGRPQDLIDADLLLRAAKSVSKPNSKRIAAKGKAKRTKS